MRSLSKIGGSRDGRGRAGEIPSDRIERAPRAPGAGWDVALVWFMRATALVWIAKGAATWAEILDALPGAPPFESEAVGRQAAILYFAVIDLTAGVGLWLTSAWGGVVWLLAATSALTLAVLTPQLLPMSPVVLASHGGFVVIYFVLSLLAAREIR